MRENFKLPPVSHENENSGFLKKVGIETRENKEKRKQRGMGGSKQRSLVGTQKEMVVSGEDITPQEIVDLNAEIEVSPLEENTIAYLKQLKGTHITGWTPEVLRGLREIGFGVEGIAPDPSPDSSINVACTDSRGRLQEFVLNPQEALDLLNNAVELYIDNEEGSNERPIKDQKKFLDVSAKKIRAPQFSFGKRLNVPKLEGEMNSLKYKNKEPVNVRAEDIEDRHEIVTTPKVEEIQNDAGKSSQATGVETLDIDEYRRIEDERGRRRKIDADMFAKRVVPRQQEESLARDNTIQKGPTLNAEEKSKPEKQKFFDSRFETEFLLTEEQLEGIEGFSGLSQGQQKLVLENLREYARDTRGGYLSRAWEGILKATGREAKDKNYVEAVTVLIRNTAQFGPKVHEENGELLTDFIDIETPRPFRKEHKPVFDRFNALAHRYAKMKVEDLEDGIGTHSQNESKFVSFFKNTFSESRRKHDTYEALQESYESAKRALAQSLTEMGKSEGEIAEKLIEIDSKVHSLRFLQTEPEAVDVIKQNPDQSFWQKVGEKVFSKENMAYAGLGFVGRMALTGAMGLYAAPVVASAVGGIRSWNKTAAELREADRAVRGGERKRDPKIDVIKGEMNVIIETQKNMNLSDTEKRENPEYKELVKKLDGLNERLIRITGIELNVIDVSREIDVGGKKKEVGVTHKLKDLIEKYKVVEGGEGAIEEKNAIIESIRARVQYTEDKIKLNRINFGSGAERAANMAGLFEVLGEARVLLADIEMPKGSALEARLEQYLISREGLIQTRRRKKQIKTATWGTLKAGALALAGRELAEYVQETGFFDKVTSGVGGFFGENSPSPQGDEIPTKPKVGYGSDQAIESSKLDSVVQKTQARGAIPESAPEIQKSAPYRIKAGDTLTKILKEQAPSIKELGNTQAQENAVANILRSLTPNEMDSIGLRSHNIDNIRVDDSIDVGKLNKIIAEKQSIIDSAQSRFGGEPVRSYTEASPRSGSQQGGIVKDADVPLKTGEVVTAGKDAGDIVLEQQAEVVPKVVVQEENLPEKPSVNVEPDVSDVGNSRVGTVEDNALSSESTSPNYADDGGTALDTEASSNEVKPVQQNIEGISINKHGVSIDETRSNIYKAKTIDGKEILISHGGGDLKSRVDEAYAYAEKNPGTTVYVEGESKMKLFSPDLPPPMIAVTAPTGVVKDVDLNIMDSKVERAFSGNIDINSFTERLTKR